MNIENIRVIFNYLDGKLQEEEDQLMQELVANCWNEFTMELKSIERPVISAN